MFQPNGKGQMELISTSMQKTVQKMQSHKVQTETSTVQLFFEGLYSIE